MADRASRKVRQRQKREKKRQALRRAASVSPYKRAAAGALVACRVNADWRERGQATVYVLRRPPGAGTGLAMSCFLVDLWCAGLKDAWGRFDMLREEYDDVVERMGDRMGEPMPEVPVEEAAAIVAGGIRFAVRNGFRLPPHLQRWTAFLSDGGDKLDWHHADLSAFGLEGGTKLRWVGPTADLRARLIGSTVEQFFARADVEFIGDVGPFMAPGDFDDEWDEGYEDDEYDDDEDDDFAADETAFRRPPLEDAEVISATDGPLPDAPPVPPREGLRLANADPAGGHGESPEAHTPEESFRQFARMTHSLVAAVEAWCFNEGLVPSPQLEKAAAFTLGSGLATQESGDTAQADRVLDRLMDTVPDEQVDDVEAGIQQVSRFIHSHPSPAAFRAAMEAAGRWMDEEAVQWDDAAPEKTEAAEREPDGPSPLHAANATDAQRR